MNFCSRLKKKHLSQSAKYDPFPLLVILVRMHVESVTQTEMQKYSVTKDRERNKTIIFKKENGIQMHCVTSWRSQIRWTSVLSLYRNH